MSGAYVLLADGARFDGESCGATGSAVGEIVFTTSMSGYQETVTDPSYAGQLITFTAPQVGNYGVSGAAMESDRVHARAVIMRAGVNHPDILGQEPGWLDWLSEHGVPAITDLDTRALVRHIRDAGAMPGGVFPADVEEATARRLIGAEPPMAGRDLTHEVSPAGPIRALAAPGAAAPVRIAMIDTGVKASIVRALTVRGAEVTRHPRTVTAAELLDSDAEAFFLANGPGDPAALGDIVETVRGLIGQRPVYGICLGHQLLCRAVGLETYKLAFGHHGANHPVRDLSTGRTEITAQNHGFAVLGPDGARTVDVDEPVRWETAFGAAELTHVNLYDRTVEGVRLLDVPAATVQYHPEAGPGPNDSLYLFDRFLAEIRLRRSTSTPPEPRTA
jgi:carbamoyl-phosphate synthase small subunit